MLAFHRFLPLLLAVLQRATGDEPEPVAAENGIYVLTPDNFDAFTERHSAALIEFYAPWCGHCKALAPEYEKAADQLKEKGSDVPLAKVDATAYVELAKRFDVNGYPTLKFWKDGQFSEYDGDRSAAGIVEWIRERTDPNYVPPPDDVLVLTGENFTSVALTADLILVEFYAPWCGHCKKLAPEYKDAAKSLKEHDPPIPVAKVDATVEKDLATQYQVTAFPTLKLFRKGRPYDYTGPRSALGIFEYMAERSLPAVKELHSMKELKRFMVPDDITVLALFDSESDEGVEKFNDAAEALRDNFPRFCVSYGSEIKKHYDVDHGVLLLFPDRYWSKTEPKFKRLMQDNPTTEDIVAFINNDCMPRVGERTPSNKDTRYTKRPLVVVYYDVNFDFDHREATQYWRQKILQVASNYPDYYFAISDESTALSELSDAGLDESGLDINVVVYGKDGYKYVMDPDVYDEFNEQVFSKFLKDVTQAKVKPHIKSEPIPQSDSGPVKTVVGSTFEDLVFDESKDVLIELYAPWCGHCKAFEPVYKELAENLSSEKQLVIAKMNAVNNDSPASYPVHGFPTIFFAPAGKKQSPISYTGGRTVEEITKFLKENAVVSFKS